jgi:hypothetical protein
MKKHVSLLSAVILTTVSLHGTAFAAVSAEEAEQLGKNLTLWGAEKAGNAAGTIPPYTGGLPKNFKMPDWDEKAGRYPSGPFDNEKPLFTITNANMEQYKSNLTAGQIELFKKYPKEFRMNIYPSHRSISWKDRTASFCKKNALNAKLTANGSGFEGAYECVPFPIPKNGYEVLWNFNARPVGGYRSIINISNYLVPAVGSKINLVSYTLDFVHPYHDPNKDFFDAIHVEKRIGHMYDPPSMAGQIILIWGSSDFNKMDLKTWFYTPGQRRVRLAPDFSYDSPISLYNGAITSDESSGFDGNPDRFDMKLVGKKEIYVNYNNNRALFAPIDKVATPFVRNPDLDRWELHRVWVVDATLKPGKRHRDSRRTLYIDEDSWAMEATDYYDHAGKVHRLGFFSSIPLPQFQTYAFNDMLIYDLNKREYIAAAAFNNPDSYVKILPDDPADISRWTSAAMEASGIR